jgi:hypothetical protein
VSRAKVTPLPLDAIDNERLLSPIYRPYQSAPSHDGRYLAAAETVRGGGGVVVKSAGFWLDFCHWRGK